MKNTKLIVKTKSDTYPIVIGSNLINYLPKLLKKNSLECNKYLLVIDKNIPKKIYLKIIKQLKKRKVYKYFFTANEKNKNQNNVNKILNILLKENFSRQDCLISIGGGITGDISGFAASLFKRGMLFVNIPTTLLSQVDSSVGGKTGVNTKQGKNLIGSFYQPKLVISDSSFLKTLPYREIVCGYGEILKHALIMDKIFYKYLKRNTSNILKLKSPYIEKAIYESCKIKKFVVEKDEKESGLRKILNFGHTFAHSYEATLGYSKKLNHGEAVILGIKTALKFSLKNKYIKKKDFESIVSHINNSKLPAKIKKYFSVKDLNKILSFMMKDKKNNSNKINIILLKKIGTTIIDKKFNLQRLKLFLKKELTN
tara:strand:+ start:686 stop:1792 length:1107 start_codon:yes stop_codon:yes gene_type:complete